MPNWKKYQSYAWIAITIGLAILAHQVLVWNRIDWSDILHHEVITIALVSFALGILLLLPKPYRKPPKIQP